MALSEPARYAAALAALGTSPARLRRMLAGRAPAAAWAALASGTHPEDPEGRGRALARPDLVAEVARRCTTATVDVCVLGDSRYPPRLAEDSEAPAVLFVRGDLGVLHGDAPRVAVVGTRCASATGLGAARAMGEELAVAGVIVVSGLATGIDSAALTGAAVSVGAPTVAVLGTAHDGRAHAGQRELREAIARRGVVLSELPPGSDSPRWRFATRNRIMAALSDVVVVVESHVEGGALHTVTAARRRGVPVAAVPGSVRNAASAGSNALLVGGAPCVRHAGDVVALLAQVNPAWAAGRLPVGPGRPDDHDREPASVDGDRARVLSVLEAEPVDLGGVVQRSGLTVSAVALALEQLAQRGLAAGERGWWYRLGVSGAQASAASTPRPATTSRRGRPWPPR